MQSVQCKWVCQEKEREEMNIKIEICCDNAAFEDNAGGEVKRCVDDVMNRGLRASWMPGRYNVVDYNGNKVGEMKVEE